MRLGGFVIHGNNADTLPACLDSLAACCDEVVAVDSCSTDGSAELVRARGIRSANQPWQGYGAARARAVELLSRADYVLYLDADERLLPEGVERIRAWRSSSPSARYYRLPIRDWAELPGHRFVFRVHRRLRLVRRDAAAWRREMIVHESLSARRGEAVALDAPIDHRFATSIRARGEKEDRYALLWALRAHVEGRRSKWAWVQRPAHALRNAVIKGALFRGGMDGWRLAWAVGRYHQLKYVYLDAVRAGRHASEMAAMREGRYEELFRMV